MENRINHIIARVLSGESSSDDILSLSEWLNENEKNRDEFRRLKNYWDADVAFKHSVAPAFSADKLQQKINVQRRQTARRQLWRNAIPLIAAACLLFIFSTALFLYNTNNRTSEHYTLLTDEHTSNFTLEDGTVITLNKNSRLSYSDKYGKDSRNVKLEGEAYFEVAKDTAHPFIVKTDLLETQVLGTSFNIRVYSPDNAHVTLLEGSIKVSDTHHTKELLIKPGQNATLQKGGTFSIHEVQAKEYSTWAEGQFYFDDTELIEIMRELGRWYNVNIIFTSKEAMHYRMHFQSDRGDSLPQVLNLLNSMQKVNAKFENDKVIVGL